MVARPAAGGGRWVLVAPDRLRGWIDGFADRHGRVTASVAAGPADVVRLHAADGALAHCHVPFPPLRVDAGPMGEGAGDCVAGDRVAGDGAAGHDAVAARAAGVTASDLPPHPARSPSPVDLLVDHAARDRRVGVILVRLGGYAAGLFEGERLIVSKVGARHVQGRSAAGGWSQQRFARRRGKQAGEALRAAADAAVRVLGPHAGELDALVLGGDRRAVDALRGDPRLAPLLAREAGPFLTVPDPRAAVLRAAPGRFRAVRVRVVDPP
jgi:hypothetical protein